MIVVLVAWLTLSALFVVVWARHHWHMVRDD